MGKRAAATQNVETSKAAKVHETTTDPFEAECAPVCALLEEAEELNSTCREMLQAAAPLALHKPKEERHSYQAAIVEEIARVLGAEEARKRASIGAVEERLTEVEDEKSDNVAKLEAAQARSAQKSEERNAMAAASTAAGNVAEERQNELEAEKQKEQALATERTEWELEREEYEKAIIEMWGPLKASAYEGKEWRYRNKIIVQLLLMLEKVPDLPQSLIVALPVALKTKQDTRGNFAIRALEHGEQAISTHIQALTAKLANFENMVTEQTKRTAAAQEVAEEALRQQTAASEVSARVDTEWANGATEVSNLKKKVSAFGPAVKQLGKELEAARRSLVGFTERAAKFQALRDRSNIQPVVEPAVEVEATNEEAGAPDPVASEPPPAGAPEAMATDAPVE